MPTLAAARAAAPHASDSVGRYAHTGVVLDLPNPSPAGIPIDDLRPMDSVSCIAMQDSSDDVAILEAPAAYEEAHLDALVARREAEKGQVRLRLSRTVSR